MQRAPYRWSRIDGGVEDGLIRHDAAIITVLFLLPAGLQLSYVVTALTV
ncbi:hypothetical protein [Prescottella agglutinans]|nr:hypothetical protein [Prescottella agglutinans]